MNILYVALTRSKKSLTIFGPEGSLGVAVKHDDSNNTRKFQNHEGFIIKGDITDLLPTKSKQLRLFTQS